MAANQNSEAVKERKARKPNLSYIVGTLRADRASRRKFSCFKVQIHRQTPKTIKFWDEITAAVNAVAVAKKDDLRSQGLMEKSNFGCKKRGH